MPFSPAVDAALRLIADPASAGPDEIARVRAALGPGEAALLDRGVERAREAEAMRARLANVARVAEAGLGTAALVHELKNALGPVLGVAQLARESEGRPLAPDLTRDLVDHAARLADLVDRHVRLLESDEPADEILDVAALAEEVARYFPKLPPGVRLEVRVPPDVPRAIADRRRVLHAVANLLANARDACADSGGRIEIVARTAGERVEIVVADSGPGVDPSARPRLFEPLFTTKGASGTGLGLFLSRELLRPRGEVVLLDDAGLPAGARTAFAVRLPAAPQGTTAAAIPAPPPPPAPAAAPAEPMRRAAQALSALLEEPRPQNVLLVEDEATVRRMTKVVLEGVPRVKVIEAADARLALEYLDRTVVDFLVADKNLPDQDGLQVIQRARERRPGIDAMVVTGYPSPESATDAIRMGATDYLIKPVSDITALRHVVQSALGLQRLIRAVRRQAVPLLLAATDLREAMPPGDSVRALADQLAARLSLAVGSTTAAVAVVGEPDVQQGLRRAGLNVAAMESPADLARADVEPDLVIVAAEGPPDAMFELVTAVRGFPAAPHLLPLGRFTRTETAMAALKGRAAFVLDRPFAAERAMPAIFRAGLRRRHEAAAAALGALLTALGLSA